MRLSKNRIDSLTSAAAWVPAIRKTASAAALRDLRVTVYGSFDMEQVCRVAYTAARPIV